MPKSIKKRGVLLTILLVVMLIANFFTALIYLIFSPMVRSVHLYIPFNMAYIYGILALANFIFVIFLFKWKKWAFFAIWGSAAIAFLMNIIAGLGITISILGLLGPMILYLLLRSKWDLLD